MNDPRTNRFLGMLLPILICAWAIYAAGDGRVEIRQRFRGTMVLTGFDAVLYGICCFGVAIMLHARLYWANTDHDAIYAQVGTVAGLLVFVPAICLLVARQFLDFL